MMYKLLGRVARSVICTMALAACGSVQSPPVTADGGIDDGAIGDGTIGDGGGGGIGSCAIDFDSDCNVGAPGVCRTKWAGGNTCGPSPTQCRSSGTFAFLSMSNITIDSTIDLRRVSVYFVHKGTGSVGTMRFLDNMGNSIMSITTNADCASSGGAVQSVTAARSSRSRSSRRSARAPRRSPTTSRSP
jgi:hypothetical protein